MRVIAGQAAVPGTSTGRRQTSQTALRERRLPGLLCYPSQRRRWQV